LSSHTLSYQCHPPGFAAWSTPEWTIASGGSTDRFDAVESAYVEQGSRVLHTADEGAVTTEIAGGEVSVRGWVVTK